MPEAILSIVEHTTAWVAGTSPAMTVERRLLDTFRPLNIDL